MEPGPEQRLGLFLAQWVKMEVQQGFVAYLCRDHDVRVTCAGVVTSYPFGEALDCGVRQPGLEPCSPGCATAEQAARQLAEVLTADWFNLGIIPKTHAIVWREPPEIQRRGEFDPRWRGYARVAFVPMPAGAVLSNCEAE